MAQRKKIPAGVETRLTILRAVFPDIEHHLLRRPSGVSKSDLLDAAVAAWTALRIHRGEALQLCEPEQDGGGWRRASGISDWISLNSTQMFAAP